jgi:hypothetical protein
MRELNWFQLQERDKSRERLNRIIAMRDHGMNGTAISKALGLSRQRAHMLLRMAQIYETETEVGELQMSVVNNDSIRSSVPNCDDSPTVETDTRQDLWPGHEARLNT